MKNIKILMIIIGIVIILIVLLLLGIRNPENLNEYDGGEETEAQDTLVEINSNINKETNDYKFFAVDDLINDFMIYINTENQEAVNALIDSSYSQEYNVQNISGTIDRFYSQEMYKQDSVTNSIYYVRGIVELVNSQNEINVGNNYFKVYVDNNNLTASIVFLTEQEYKSAIEANSNEIEEKTIEQNEYNKFEEKMLTEWDLSERYIEDYELKLKYNIDEAYNLLDEDYKNKKFNNNIQDFENYVEQNKEILYNISIYNCTTQIEENYIQYNVEDANNNIFVIKRTNALEYKILLDNVTV